MVARGKRRQFSDGEFIQHRGDVADGFWIVIKGQIMSGRYAADGSLTIFAVLGPGDMLGENSFLAGTPRLADIVSDGASELVFIDGPTLKALIAEDPDVSMLLLHSLASQLHSAFERIDLDRQVKPEIRLARSLSGMVVAEDGRISVTQQHLADLIGVSRVTLGAALKRLEDAGLIEHRYGTIRIHDRKQLKRWIAANSHNG